MKKTKDEKILVLGVSGMVGHKMWQVVRSRFENVFGTIRRSINEYQNHPLFQTAPKGSIFDHVDLFHPTAILSLLDSVKPTVIINCVGLTYRRVNSDSVEDNIRLNALLPHVINGWCERNSCRLISFSTDCVFSGNDKGGYTETSTTDEKSAYGRTKALGEVISNHALILRTSVIGPEIEYKTQLLEWFLSQQGSVRGFCKTYFSGITTRTLGQIVNAMILEHRNTTGLFNVASEPISKHDLLTEFRRVYGKNIEIIPDHSKVSRKDLDGSKFKQTVGLRIPSWRQMIEEMKDDEC